MLVPTSTRPYPDRMELIPGGALARLEAGPDALAVLRALADRAVALGAAGPGFGDALLARERVYPTGLPTPIGTAIPHADPEHVLQPGLMVASLVRPVPFAQMGAGIGAHEGATEAVPVPVSLVVALLLRDADEHLAALQALMGHLTDEEKVREAVAAPDDASLAAIVGGWFAG